MPTSMSSPLEDALRAPSPAVATGAASATDDKDSSAEALRILEAAMQEAFVAAMTLVDEEDAVLLYRCSRLASASPLLLESCDLRRKTIEEGLSDRCQQLWTSSRLQLTEAIDRGHAAARTTSRALSSRGDKDKEAKLEVARRAASVRERQHGIETRAAVQAELRLRAEEDAAALARAREQMRAEIEGHRKRAEREIAEALGRSQREVGAAQAREANQRSIAERTAETLRRTEADLQAMTGQLYSEREAASAADERCRQLEMRLSEESAKAGEMLERAKAAERSRDEALREVSEVRESIAADAELVRLEGEARGLEVISLHLPPSTKCMHPRGRGAGARGEARQGAQRSPFISLHLLSACIRPLTIYR